MKFPYHFIVNGPEQQAVHPFRTALGSGMVSSKELIERMTRALESIGCQVEMLDHATASEAHICKNCGAELIHKVDDEHSSCPDEWWECPKCGRVGE